jgi:uncharacterized protein (DUF2249 family)
VTTVDLRTVPAPLRHDHVYESLELLTVGSVLELVVDHRPTPLRYELDATSPGDHEWVDGEDGPEVWSARLVAVRVVWDPPWTPERMDDCAAGTLGFGRT